MNLVVNGCSYMESYAVGQGHVDLAQQLALDCPVSLAIDRRRSQSASMSVACRCCPTVRHTGAGEIAA